MHITDEYGSFLELAVKAARAAGETIREGTKGALNISHKSGPQDLLTDVDLAADRIVVETILAQYPDHDILSEERPPDDRQSPYCWMIDPIDGTSNFAHRYPCFSTSIALTYHDTLLVGVVYDPMRDQLFSAMRNKGAALNDQPIKVSEKTAWNDMIVGMDWANEMPVRMQTLGILNALIPHCHGARACGSAALGICYVAAGWWETYVHLSLSPWDAAAGALIVSEAGGQVTDVMGAPWRPVKGSCIASNGARHRELCTKTRLGAGLT